MVGLGLRLPPAIRRRPPGRWRPHPWDGYDQAALDEDPPVNAGARVAKCPLVTKLWSR